MVVPAAILCAVTYPVPVNLVFIPNKFKRLVASLLEYPFTSGIVILESLVTKNILSLLVILIFFSGYWLITLSPLPIII